MQLFGDGRRSLLLRPADISASFVRPFVNPFCTIFLTLSLCNTSACRFRALDAPCRLYQPLLVAVAADVTGGRFLGYQGGVPGFRGRFRSRPPQSGLLGAREGEPAPVRSPFASPDGLPVGVRSPTMAQPSTMPSPRPCPAPCAVCARPMGCTWLCVPHRAVWPAAVCCAWPHGLPSVQAGGPLGAAPLALWLTSPRRGTCPTGGQNREQGGREQGQSRGVRSR